MARESVLRTQRASDLIVRHPTDTTGVTVASGLISASLHASCHRQLRCHPGTSCSFIEAITVDVAHRESGGLALRYRIVGELSQLKVPARGSKLDPDRLWEHTCLELFARSHDGDRYFEWNFSPSGQRARFEFTAYRQRCPGAGDVGELSLERASGVLTLDATVDLPPSLGSKLAIGLTAVAQDVRGERSYWALRHPSETPDFHHRDGFALPVDLPQSGTS